MMAVSDTSPIINLAVIGQLDLLRQLYGTVVIPPAVYEEIAVTGAGQPGAADVASASWIQIRQVSNSMATASSALELDEGEAEAIALAAERRRSCSWMCERGASLPRAWGCATSGCWASSCQPSSTA